jgi:hypothetical protein
VRKPRVIVSAGRWTAEVRGPARVIVDAVLDVCGTAFSIEWDSRSRSLRVPIAKAHDLVAALESRGARVDLRGRLPDPELFA